MSEHAKLSPSAAHRWLSCPSSLSFEASMSDESSPQAARGTMLHEIAEKVLNGVALSTYEHDLDGEDLEIVEKYTNYIWDLIESIGVGKADLHVEQRVHFNKDIWGTADAVIVSPYRLDIVDLKTGSGVKVDARHNDQLMIYALAVLNEFNQLPGPFRSDKPPQEVHLHIVQPSLGNYSEWEVKVNGAEFNNLRTQIKAVCQIIEDGVEHYQPSESACQFCRGRAQCKARAEFNLKLVVEDFAMADPNTLTAEDLAYILPQVPQIVAWAQRVQEFATASALAGQSIPGYKLVQSIANRQWRDDKEVIGALIAEGLDEALVIKRKPIGIGAAEKLLGKSHKIFADHCTKPAPKPTLAPSSDKREIWLCNDGSEFEGSVLD